MSADVPSGWTVPATPRREWSSLTAIWPVPQRIPDRRLIGGAAASGVLAATVVGADPGLGIVLTVAAMTAAVWPSTAGHRSPRLLGFLALGWLLVLPTLVLTAPWVIGLDLLAALGSFTAALVPGSTWFAVLVTPLALPFAAVRGRSWIRPSLLRLFGRRAGYAPASAWMFGLCAAAVGLTVFGALFSSADPAFRHLLDEAAPNVQLRLVPARICFAAVVAIGVLCAGFVALSPPRLDALHPRPSRTAARQLWLTPVLALVVLFTAFVVVQFTVLFAGNQHILRTAGLTYADYAHQGFSQLVAVTVLTLLVVGAVTRWAPKQTRVDRRLLRLTLGLLCLLTLVIVASALRRLQLYDAAYGLTRLRVFAVAFVGWTGALLLLVLIAGLRLRGDWLPQAAVASAGVALLVLTAANPDALIARTAVSRYEHTGQIDAAYLAGLSADAAPAVRALPAGMRGCVWMPMVPGPQDWRSWNLSRVRTQGLIPPAAGSAPCFGS
ncbi:MAG: hypothetical protein QOI76_2934 [Frankiales bacterium]|nr:hypothetical protein [Frankiales bacterium]